MQLCLTMNLADEKLPQLLDLLAQLAGPGPQPDGGAVPAPVSQGGPTGNGGAGAAVESTDAAPAAPAATPLSAGVEEYLEKNRSARFVDDARRLLKAAAAAGYVLLVGGSKSEPYLMVFMDGPRHIGALGYVRPRPGHIRLRLPKESAALYAHGSPNPNQRLYQVDVSLSAPIEELLAALAEAEAKGRQPGRWMGDPEVAARRAAARAARTGSAPDPDSVGGEGDGDDLDDEDDPSS